MAEGTKPGLDTTLREQLEFLVSSLNVARLALDCSPDLAEKELRRCRSQLVQLQRCVEERPQSESLLLVMALREVENHLSQAEAMLEQRLVSA